MQFIFNVGVGESIASARQELEKMTPSDPRGNGLTLEGSGILGGRCICPEDLAEGQTTPDLVGVLLAITRMTLL